MFTHVLLGRGSLVAVLLVAAILAPLPAAQSVLELRDMSGVRGLVGQGQGGFVGPPFAPIPGNLGSSCAILDANGDGFDDVLVGAPTLPTNPTNGVEDDAGHAYLYFGGPGYGLPNSSPDADFASLSLGEGINFIGAPGDRAGVAVAAAGDVNDDGIEDFLIGAPGRSPNGRTAAGGAYLIFGSTNLATLSAAISLEFFAANNPGAVFIQGAREFGSAGSSVSGRVDCDNDGVDDFIIGAPLDSTNDLMQNGTATVVYGFPGLFGQSSVDMALFVPGDATIVHGSTSFQLMGHDVAGLGRFDPVLPMTNNLISLFGGDDVAIGAPGTSPAGKLFAGAVYVLRGEDGSVPAFEYTANDFGNGPNTAGVFYTGDDAGDQAGFDVARGDDMIFDGQGFDDLILTAPFSDGIGKPDSGSVYVVAGALFGVNPQGFDMGELGAIPPTLPGIHVQGAQSADGQQGTYASSAGDWNGNGRPDLVVGHPNQTYLSASGPLLGAGRVRLLDSDVLFFSNGTVDLSRPPEGAVLLEFAGEENLAFAGAGLCAGDMNGDGNLDIGVGAPGAPSDPNPLDPSGVALTRTGRMHVVYGPVFRIEGVSPDPAVSFHGGPEITVIGQFVSEPEDINVLIDGVLAEVTGGVAGSAGSITFRPPAPLVPGNLADISVGTPLGTAVLLDALQFEIFSIISAPAEGFEGLQVEYTAMAVPPKEAIAVTVNGVVVDPASIDSDPAAGTFTFELPAAPIAIPLAVDITTSNGSDSASITYQTLVVTSVTPATGTQYSGVFDPGILSDYPGLPAESVDVEVAAFGAPIDPSIVIEFGGDDIGWELGEVTRVVGNTVTLDLPPKLLGNQDTLVDVRATFDGDVSVLENGFTYLASDFTSMPLYEKVGYGVGGMPPRCLMAGEFTEGGEVLLMMDRWPPEVDLTLLVLGFALADPPVQIKGGLFAVDTTLFGFTFFFPFPGFPGFNISADMPAVIDPSANGFPLFMQVITKEKGAQGTKWGFSSALEMKIRLDP